MINIAIWACNCNSILRATQWYQALFGTISSIHQWLFMKIMYQYQRCIGFNVYRHSYERHTFCFCCMFCVFLWLYRYYEEWRTWVCEMVNHISLVTAVTSTGHPKSVRTHCVIEKFCGVFVLQLCIFIYFLLGSAFCHRTESDLFILLFL